MALRTAGVAAAARRRIEVWMSRAAMMNEVCVQLLVRNRMCFAFYVPFGLLLFRVVPPVDPIAIRHSFRAATDREEETKRKRLNREGTHKAKEKRTNEKSYTNKYSRI